MLSEKLYKLRKSKGLSQEQLAEQMNVSRQAISKWEQGTAVPESEKLIAISNYFGVTVDYLLKEDTADEAYKYLFTGFYGKGIDECNAFLEEIGVETPGSKQRF